MQNVLLHHCISSTNPMSQSQQCTVTTLYTTNSRQDTLCLLRQFSSNTGHKANSNLSIDFQIPCLNILFTVECCLRELHFCNNIKNHMFWLSIKFQTDAVNLKDECRIRYYGILGSCFSERKWAWGNIFISTEVIFSNNLASFQSRASKKSSEYLSMIIKPIK